MRTTIIMMFLLFLISRSAYGQKGNLNYFDSDSRKKYLPIVDQKRTSLDRSIIKSSKEFNKPNNSKVKIIYQDYGYLPLNQDNGNITRYKPIKNAKHIEKSHYYAPYYNMPESLNRNSLKARANY